MKDKEAMMQVKNSKMIEKAQNQPGMVIPGAPAEEVQSAEEQRKEQPTEMELDTHHKVLMDAQAIRDNPELMALLKGHLSKKMKGMKGLVGDEMDIGDDSKITSIDGLKEKYKSMG